MTFCPLTDTIAFSISEKSIAPVCFLIISLLDTNAYHFFLRFNNERKSVSANKFGCVVLIDAGQIWQQRLLHVHDIFPCFIYGMKNVSCFTEMKKIRKKFVSGK
jgi:hypothetical protein